jgi:hypothetical protein
MVVVVLLALICGLSSVAQGQPFLVGLMETDEILYRNCTPAQGPLADGTLIQIYWDCNHNGPDSADFPVPCVPFCPGAPLAGGNTFPMNGEMELGQAGLFYPNVYWTGTNPDWFYLYLHADTLCYWSAPFLPAVGPSEIEMTGWTCGPCSGRIPCETEPPWLSVLGDDPQCARLCESVPLVVAFPEDQGRVPMVEIRPGCADSGTSCYHPEWPPDADFRFDPFPWRWTDICHSWYSYVYGTQNGGAVCIHRVRSLDLDLQSFMVETAGGAPVVQWSTGTEDSLLDHFELWHRVGSADRELVVSLPAQHGAGEHDYQRVDSTAGADPTSYWLLVADTEGHLMRVADGTVTAATIHLPSPTAHDFALRQNYPNPFNATTTIDFELARNIDGRLSIYNVIGQEVAVLANGQMTAGKHSIVFDGGSLPSGIYLCSLTADGFTAHTKMLLIK